MCYTIITKGKLWKPNYRRLKVCGLWLLERLLELPLPCLRIIERDPSLNRPGICEKVINSFLKCPLDIFHFIWYNIIVPRESEEKREAHKCARDWVMQSPYHYPMESGGILLNRESSGEREECSRRKKGIPLQINFGKENYYGTPA